MYVCMCICKKRRKKKRLGSVLSHHRLNNTKDLNCKINDELHIIKREGKHKEMVILDGREKMSYPLMQMSMGRRTTCKNKLDNVMVHFSVRKVKYAIPNLQYVWLLSNYKIRFVYLYSM